MRLIICLLLLCGCNVAVRKQRTLNLESVRNVGKHIRVYNFGNSKTGTVKTFSKAAIMQGDRRSIRAYVDTIDCFETRFVQVNVTTTNTHPLVKIQHAGRRLAVVFSFSYTKAGGQNFAYSIAARGDYVNNCTAHTLVRGRSPEQLKRLMTVLNKYFIN